MDNQLSQAEVRRARRRAVLESFLAEFVVQLGQLAVATRKELEQWALLVSLPNEPTASPRNLVRCLGCAVESEVASRLGPVEGFEFLKEDASLGATAARLDRLPANARERVATLGLKPGMLTILSKDLRHLKDLRNPASHGAAEPVDVSHADADRAAPDRDDL